ncbi:amidohydrolase family protein [Aquabacterium sp.]|uniref:amidohydrolase family protein n=1 Tax=Aquabacterium sp. TaxID=1872578 RepID=UPI002BEBF026|nr:TatD family hydrolase [Aquabacterium sp.]HSW04911.1 TatD family hydrolase [Aquabacterium sp.]
MATVLGCAATAPPHPAAAAPAAPPPIPFIDAHVHLNDEAMQLDLMQRHGAERAIVFWGRNSSNESIADAARRLPQRFIAFATISPERAAYRRAWETQDAALLQTLDDLLASGRFQGIGEVSAVHFPSPGFPEADHDPLGPMMSGIMALARKHRVPVLLHIEWTRLREFSQLLANFPDVPVIWAHGGYTPLFIAQRLLAQHPNLTYELSARTWPRHPRSPDYTILRDGEQVWPEWLALIESQPQRFIVGTDASHRSRDSEEMKFRSVQSFLRQLSPTTREWVARGNLLKLLAR